MTWTLLPILLAWGTGPVQSPQVSPAPPPSQVVAPAQETDASRVARLKALVAQAEKAVDDEAFLEAGRILDAADVLTSDWPTALLADAEVQALLQKVQDLETQLPESANAEPEDGLKAKEEVVSLSGEDLRAELERVRSAERDTSYDFPIDLNDKVLTWVNLFSTTKRGFMENALSRASMYLPMIRQVFAEEGIPQDLAFLAVIESGFRNEAKSRARAVGMWQFIRSTGRLYGLTYNRWIEERRDPVKATHAAARYLKRLYEITGDWYLAVSSYNAGPLSLDRAAQNLGTRNFWDLARSRWLRTETKNYVPELCAAILVGRHPDRYGIQVDAAAPFAYETVTVPNRTSLASLARLADTDTATLKHLNPELLRDSTPPGSYVLRVPPGKALLCARALAKGHGAAQVVGKTYTIRRGDTLSKVAERLGVDPDELLAENRITARSFRPGRKLRVPGGRPVPARAPLQALPYLPGTDVATLPEPKGGTPPPAIGAGTQVGAAPTLPTRPQATEPVQTQRPSTPQVSEDAAEQGAHTVRVRPGDTLAKLARLHGVALGDLIRLNPEGAKRLHPGDEVRLPGSEPHQAQKAAKTEYHRVKRGDTLAGIAREHQVTVAELRAWNGLKGDRIHPGQRLRLAPR